MLTGGSKQRWQRLDELQTHCNAATLLAWNPNSLNYRLGELFRKKAEVICITESRQFREEVKHTELIAARAGWGLLASAARRTEGGGRSRGVTLLCKAGVPERLDLTQKLTNYESTGRLLVARIPVSSMRTTLVVAGVYGFPDEPHRTAVLLKELFEFLAGYGNEKCIIMGDLNMELEDGWIDEELTEGWWFDAMEQAAEEGIPEPTSYCARRPRRIDHILLNKTAFSCLREAATIEDVDTHPHVPIYCQLRGKEPVVERRVAMPPALKPGEQQRLSSRQWLDDHASRWDLLLEQSLKDKDAEAAIHTFSRKWEAYSRAVLDSKLQGGRGLVAEEDTASGPMCTGQESMRRLACRLWLALPESSGSSLILWHMKHCAEKLLVS